MMDRNGQGTATAGTRLFSVEQIVLATFLGAPIAGFLLLARNYQRLGNKAYARVSLLWGVVATAVLLTVTWYLPESSARWRHVVEFLRNSKAAVSEKLP